MEYLCLNSPISLGDGESCYPKVSLWKRSNMDAKF